MPFPDLLPQSEDMVKNIYQGILEPQCWRTFLGCLRRRLDCDVAAMALKSVGSNTLTYAIWDRQLPLKGAESKAAASEYKKLAHLDPLANALKSSGDIYTLDEVVSHSELIRSEYYHRVIKRFDFKYQLAMYVSASSGLEGHIGIVNGLQKENFGDFEKSYLSVLRPDIECALKIFVQMQRDALMVEAYSAALNNLPASPFAKAGAK